MNKGLVKSIWHRCHNISLNVFLLPPIQDLPFKKGDRLVIVAPSKDPSWYKARREDGLEGMIPFNYVQEKASSVVSHVQEKEKGSPVVSRAHEKAPPAVSRAQEKEKAFPAVSHAPNENASSVQGKVPIHTMP